MAAPSIPPLRSRGGPRLRERGRDRAIAENGDFTSSVAEQASQRDKIVQQTDNDALSSRLSAVELGYLDDEFARAFKAPGERMPRRYPIINRGTYVRTTAIDTLVQRFLRHEPGARKQIISLGAGSDTRYFRLCTGSVANVVYHELDFPENVAAKKAAFDRSPQLFTLIPQQDQCDGSAYHLHPMDLRSLPSGLPADIPHLEKDLPTLLLSECCLCYLPPSDTTAILKYFTDRLPSVGLIIYEAIRPHDAFGRTMITNLASRGIHMQTLERYSTLAAQRGRLRLAGFTDGQGARDVYGIWDDRGWVSGQERERVEKLEWLDEVEEWKLIGSHYCVAWGWRGDCLTSAWSDVAGARTKIEDDED